MSEVPAPTFAEVRSQLAKANRILASESVVDDFGHVSARHPERPDRFIIPSSMSSALVTEDDLFEYTLDCQPVQEMTRRSYSERVIHGAIYSARPDVHAICHHHAAALIPFASSSLQLRAVYHLGALMGKEVPVWDSRDEFGDTRIVLSTLTEADSLARSLGANRIVLLRRHGAVVVGSNIKEMVFSSIYVAENASLQLRMVGLNDISYLSEGEIELAGKVVLAPTTVERSWRNRCARWGFEP